MHVYNVYNLIILYRVKLVMWVLLDPLEIQDLRYCFRIIDQHLVYFAQMINFHLSYPNLDADF